MLPSISGLAQQNVISYSYHSLMQVSPFLFGDLGARTFHSVAVNLEHPNTKVPAEGQKDTGKYCAMASAYGPNLEVFYITYVYILLVRIQSDGLQPAVGKIWKVGFLCAPRDSGLNASYYL